MSDTNLHRRLASCRVSSFMSLTLILFLAGLIFAINHPLLALNRNIGMAYLVKALDLRIHWPKADDGRTLSISENWLRQAAETGSLSAMRGLGIVNAIKGNDGEAISAWRSVTGIVPDLLLWGKQAQRADQHKTAIRWFGLAAQVEPDNRDPWYFMGASYAALGDLDKSLNAYYEGLKRNWGREVGSSNLYFQIGHTKRHRIKPPDFDGSWKAHEQALLLDDFRIFREKTETFYQRGTILEWRGEWENAINEYEKALALNPNHYWAILGLARASWRIGRIEKAKELYSLAMQLEPHTKWAYRELGFLYSEVGNDELAIEELCKALQLDPGDERVFRALTRFSNQLDCQGGRTQ